MKSHSLLEQYNCPEILFALGWVTALVAINALWFQIPTSAFLPVVVVATAGHTWFRWVSLHEKLLIVDEFEKRLVRLEKDHEEDQYKTAIAVLQQLALNPLIRNKRGALGVIMGLKQMFEQELHQVQTRTVQEDKKV